MRQRCSPQYLNISPEYLLHDAAQDGVLHRGEHELDVVRVCGDGDVRVDLGPSEKIEISHKCQSQFQFDIPEILDRVEEELQNVLLGLDTVTTASRVGREVVSQIKITNFLIKNVLLVEEENHGALSEPGVPQNGVKQSDGLL